MSANRVTCALIDDHTLIRAGAQQLCKNVDVTSTYSSVESFIASGDRPDVVLLDLTLREPGASGGLQGRAAIVALRAEAHRVCIYTSERRTIVLAGCLAAGAQGIVHKSEPVADLESAIEGVAAGRTVISLALAGLAEAVRNQGQMTSLSDRQRAVLSGRARGESFKSIGRRLGISERTAHDHMNRVHEIFAEFLASHSPADLERHLGIGADDLLG